MAIHPSYPGLEVTIVVNGNQAKEYDDGSDPDPNTTKRYVESITGAAFHVNFIFRKPFPASRPVSARLFVDGQQLSSKTMLTQGVVDQDGERYSIQGAPSYVNSVPALQEFRFSSLKSTESGDEPITEDMIRDLRSIGTISVQLRAQNRLDTSVEKPTIETYNEKAAKGNVISHMVGLGPAKAIEGYKISHPKFWGRKARFTTVYEKDEKPFLVFDFHYRSLDALKSLHIIPRTAEPVVPMDIENVNVGDLAPAEMQRLLVRLQEQHRARTETAQSQIKTERFRSIKTENGRSAGDDTDQDELEITGARPVQRRGPGRRLPQDNDVVIELD
ncbi:hypothetical protein DM02DRAFT_589586 [Periconia macrospinosa]|uniref:DUF7918 domain-containing protein n=1 Tax=Periconia macrospinosa TaxID=97972 RepID=A0A2V1DYZ1_9PLEO|nr:hypothetical protein DM02DRAFT_589586 [Periconia macrospinosa]